MWVRILVVSAPLFLAVFPAEGESGDQVLTPHQSSLLSAEQARNLELLMASQRMDKREMLKNALDLTPVQSDRFWPLYYEYQAQLIPIYDRKFALIERYADEYPDLTEKQADHLVRESLSAKKAQIELLEKYYARVSRALSRNIAARFVQLESAWNGAFDVKLQSKLPLVPKTSAVHQR
jgi:hypothetical protein